MEEIASNLRVAGMKLDYLGRAYEQLQSQASSFLLFSLQWKDLQEHFDSLSKMIGDRLETLNVREKEVGLKENQLSVIKKHLDECSKLVVEKEERLLLVQKSLDECNEEVDSQGKKLEEIRRLSQQASNDFGLKEKHLASLYALIQEHAEELEKKEKNWNAMQKSIAESSAQLEAKEKELASVQKSIGEYTIKAKAKEKKLLLMEKDIEERSKELEKKGKDLSNVQRQLRLCRQDIELKEREYHAIERSIEERGKELNAGGEELKSIQKSISNYEKLLEEYNRDLKMITDLVIEREQMLKSIQRNIGECNRDLGKKEEGLVYLKGLIKEREENFSLIDAEFQALSKKHKNDYEKREGELKSIQKKITQCDEELKTKEKALDSIQKSIFGLAKELESKGKNYDDLVAKEEELKSLQKRIDHQVGELEKDKKDFDLSKLQTKERFMELEMKQKQFEERAKNLESKEKQFNGQVKKLKLKEKQFEEQVKELESREKQVELLRKSFEDEKVLLEMGNIFLPHVKTEELDFVDTNGFENSRNLQALFNKLLKTYELVCLEVSTALQASADPAKLVLDAMQGFYPSNSNQEDMEYDANIIRRSCILLLDELKKYSPLIGSHVKEESMKLASEWKENLSVGNKDCLEVLGFLKLVATYDLGSSFNASELHLLLDIISQHCQKSELQQVLGIVNTFPDNQFNDSEDGRNLHLIANQQANANELMGSGIFVDLQTSDPAKLVINMIRHPIVSRSTKEEKTAIIAGGHIILLKWLMRISPDIKPQVREEAMKLALELKAEMRTSTENSLEVLGFLLILSIYGLASSFEEDEILELFEIAAHHKQAVELYQTLGFANKVSDFVLNLIKKQKPAEAVRFICAYELADKIPPVDLLREYVQNAKMVSKKSSFETKDKARDEELACLRTVLKCVSDNDLECQDLVKEIHNRIDELRRLKANGFGTTPGPSSKVEEQRLEQKKHSNEGFTKKRQVQPCNNKKRPRTAKRPSLVPDSMEIAEDTTLTPSYTPSR
ncbi:uncharacterized protein LOC129306968 isoform X2 [Prosopis cineraria]|uniref:uncharacterized protein LOC129306968 isoform X2 n=1 Tax=Prosopis cineraria TaxID=364024 RepID=UPI0024100422|nr:uncharacterized protein LOC129306968 isoform X2 [Prosopis cineraria]